jgi:ATP-dependent DNA ligase
VFEARHRQGSAMAFTAFDLLEIDSHSALAEPWTARRKHLEDLLDVGAWGRVGQRAFALYHRRGRSCSLQLHLRPLQPEANVPCRATSSSRS